MDEENDEKLYQYGVEFRIDENDRKDLVKILNDFQIKITNNISFSEEEFILGSYENYFK